LRTTVRALIVEDEPLARQNLRDLIDEVSWLECVGEAADGQAGLVMAQDQKPDLVFLDVRMPGMSGLKMLRSLDQPLDVVFTTAYDQYAVTAFELGALDYLVKPFSRARFHLTAERLAMRPAAVPSVRVRLEQASQQPVTRFFVQRQRELVPVIVRDIYRIDAAGDYVAVVTGAGSDLLSVSLTDILRRLDSGLFFRVHRSCAVNIEHVVSVLRNEDRRVTVRMTDGASVVASRSGSARLLERWAL